MADKHRGRFLIGRLEAADGIMEVSDPMVFEDTVDVKSGANIVNRLNVGRVRDAGDAAATLAAGTGASSDIDGTVLFYDVPIGADRAVTLTVAGAYAGMRWRIVREIAATGAFNVNVGVGPLTAMGTVGNWCEVTFDGTAWVLSAFGTLA